MKNIRDYEAMSKLNLTDGERGIISAAAEKLIGSFKELEGIDISNTEPLITVLDISNVLREDAVLKTIPREELLSAAPERYEGYFQVPRTLD